MGLAMALNLQTHLSTTKHSPLIYYNRTISRGDPLRALGARPAASVKDLFENAAIVFISVTCLPD
jgi:3-hydroxyisobutyrate dehydrogenase-like beta-hydroxyacid dehydrogenase